MQAMAKTTAAGFPSPGRRIIFALVALCATLAVSLPVLADTTVKEQAEAELLPAGVVEVSPSVGDEAIAQRLERILSATGWFDGSAVTTDEGVVFLSGTADTSGHREWAGQLARGTEGVVAVVNKLGLAQQSPWDLTETWIDLRAIAVQAARSTPLILIALLLLLVTTLVSAASVRAVRGLLSKRLDSLLLRHLIARAAAVPIFLFGLYLVLKLSGLTGLALTVLGGTGLAGLIIGFAFRDIAENFLSSILISSQRPFAIGDLIEVAGHKGFVQQVNTRSTLLMTLEGNHVQIPNSAVYKGTIINFTANPRMRADFTVGIGYNDSIHVAQETALEVLRDHPAVVNDPEPLVLVASLGASTVNLALFFWIDVSQYSQVRVLSAVIRLTKRAFERAGISMPDEAREVVFPEGIPIATPSAQADASAEPRQQPDASGQIQERSRSELDDNSMVTEAEGKLASESSEILEQAARSRTPEGENQQNLIADRPRESNA